MSDLVVVWLVSVLVRAILIVGIGVLIVWQRRRRAKGSPVEEATPKWLLCELPDGMVGYRNTRTGEEHPILRRLDMPVINIDHTAPSYSVPCSKIGSIDELQPALPETVAGKPLVELSRQSAPHRVSGSLRRKTYPAKPLPAKARARRRGSR